MRRRNAFFLFLLVSCFEAVCSWDWLDLGPGLGRAAEGAKPNLTVAVRAYPDPGKVLVSIQSPMVPGLAEDAPLKLSVVLQKNGHPPLARLEQPTTSGMREEVVLDASKAPPGDYTVTVELSLPKEVSFQQTASLHWPGRSETFKNIRILNNLVWELLNLRSSPEKPIAGEYVIRTPYPRWLFIRSAAAKNLRGRIQVHLQTPNGPIPLTSHDAQKPLVAEAMRFVQAGEHKILVTGDGQAALEHLVVRSVPEIQHSRFPTQILYIDQGVKYDWPYLSRHILPQVNTIITTEGLDAVAAELRAWKERGGKVIVYTSRPGLGGRKDLEANPKICADYWSGRPGYAHPLADGVLVDEFYHKDDPAYPIYTSAVRTLNRQFSGKAFYPYAAGHFGKDAGSVEFTAACIEGGGYVCWEAYIAEWPTLRQALNALRAYPYQHVISFEEKLPGLTRRLVWVFGVFSFPWPYADGYAHVNYNAYLDMQFQFIATHPALFGLGGLHIWRTGYCDEERLRWIGRYMRHYAIEGGTDRANPDPYLLTHLQNPDFAEGKAGWTLEPAGPDSIQPGSQKGFGKFSGRYYQGPDSFLITTRQQKPNRFRQEIRGLEPGRLYSVKMFTGDYGALTKGESLRAIHPVRLEVVGAETLSGPRYQWQQPAPTREKWGPFTEGKPFWLNLHWQVFRAVKPTAVLCISDWKSPDNAGGPPGQQILYTYIELKPYLDEEPPPNPGGSE